MAGNKQPIPWKTVSLVLIIPSLILNAYLIIRNYNTPAVATPVEGVIDGDTIVVGNKDRVRLRQMDAPELDLCGGKESKAQLEKMVGGKDVVIAEQIPDQQGRGMALVYTGRTLVNREMLTNGWATYHHDTSTKADELKAAADAARDGKLGIYGMCWSTENTENPTCNIKGNIDDKGVKKYFVPGCAQYSFTVIEKNRGEAYFCTEAAARKAGFTKAATCGGT